MLGVDIGLKAFISRSYGYADAVDSDDVLPHLARGYKQYRDSDDYWRTSTEEKFPIATAAAEGVRWGQILGGNVAGFLTTAFGTLATVGVLGASGGWAGIALGAAALAATGAVVNTAAPFVRGLFGQRDYDHQGLCAKIGWGALDGIWTPMMCAAYAGAKIGQGAGMLAGGLIGGGIGTTVHLAAKGYERFLKPYLECAPVQERLARAGQKAEALAERAAACPMPEYSMNANAAGQRLRARFASLGRKQPEAAPAPAPTEATQQPETPRSSSAREGHGGYRNGG